MLEIRANDHSWISFRRILLPLPLLCFFLIPLRFPNPIYKSNCEENFLMYLSNSAVIWLSISDFNVFRLLESFRSNLKRSSAFLPKFFLWEASCWMFRIRDLNFLYDLKVASICGDPTNRCWEIPWWVKRTQQIALLIPRSILKTPTSLFDTVWSYLYGNWSTLIFTEKLAKYWFFFLIILAALTSPLSNSRW